GRRMCSSRAHTTGSSAPNRSTSDPNLESRSRSPSANLRSVTISEVRLPHARLFVVVGAVAFAIALLLLTRSYTFYFDEWAFILSAPDWTITTYLQPHTGHPTMLTRLIYTTLLATVGLRSYLPYMAVLLALHATSVVLL